MARQPGSSISQLYSLLDASLKELGKSVAPERIESVCFLIVRCMSGRSRDFHNLSHVFSVAHGLPPLARLAVAYHDTVYFQVDQGIVPEIQERIRDAFRLKGGKVFLAKPLDEPIEEVACLFGLEPGQELPLFGGLNEFLSACFAVRELAPFLDRKELLTVAACIEQTIPFRGRDAKGHATPEILEARLAALSSRRGLGFSQEEIVAAVRLAVEVANSDVQNFADPDVGEFLDNTWKLLPEVNPEFHSVGVYSIRKFRVAIMKMEQFIATLDPERVYHSHAGDPSAKTLKMLNHRVRANLKYAGEYLRAKTLSMTVLEALAEVTGGDAPVSYFTGAADSHEKQLHEYLPELERPSFVHLAELDLTVLQLLKYGRQSEVKFDTTSSPISAYLYEALGAAGVEKHFRRAGEIWTGKRDWQWFLDGLPGELVATIAEAAAQIAIGRAERLRALASCRRTKKVASSAA